MIRTRIALLAFLLALLAPPLGAAAGEPQLPDLQLTYSASWNGIGLGEVAITLRPGEATDCYRYESRSKPVGLVKMFYGAPRELSEFCVRGGQIVPHRFSFFSSRGEDKDFTLSFDAGKVTDHKGKVRDVPPNAQDRFGIQQAVRLWLLGQVGAKEPGTVEFAQVDDRRIRHYRFAITAFEKVEVPAGTFEAILVQRIDDPRKTNKFWIAPAVDYMPVKVETLRDGDADLRMVLRRAGPGGG